MASTEDDFPLVKSEKEEYLLRKLKLDWLKFSFTNGYHNKIVYNLWDGLLVKTAQYWKLHHKWYGYFCQIYWKWLIW